MKTKKAKQSEKLGDLKSNIMAAARLAEQIAVLSASFELLKEQIRAAALPMIADGENHVKIETDLGECMVSRVKDHIAIAKGVDPEVLQLTMPSDLWNTLFVMKPVFRATAGDAWLRLKEEQRATAGDPCPFFMAHRQAQVTLPK